jgi:hypothetical protein
MSMFGHDLAEEPTPTSGSSPTQTASGLGGLFSSVWKNITDTIDGGLDDLRGDIADKLAAELGISQWYSVHLLDTCQGSYSPNATAPGAGYNVTNCTTQTPGNRVNLTDVLSHELELGPFHLNLAQLHWPSGIQNQLDKLNRLLLAVFVLYVLGAGLSGLAMIGAAAAIFTALRGAVTLSNFAVALLAALALAVGAVITTVAAKEGADTINDFGAEVGVVAVAGQQFIVISWVAFAVMAAATIYWTAEFFLARRARRRVFTEKHRKGSY